MGAFDPVDWETVEAATGPPAPEITDYVEQLQTTLQDEAPYDAVKTVHDALYESEVERTVPNVGEPFVTAYLLEKHGVIEDAPGNAYHSLVARRPDRDRLVELFWERERTLWWIGVLAGVHPSLVTYWFYEDDIPLMERNFSEASMNEIRAIQESTDR